MADIVLRDRNGAALQYPGVERVKFNTADGGQVEFVDPALIPEDAEAFIDTDETGFANGDIEITPEEGSKFSKVTVKKPENLLPENIVAGVDIAGVVGTSGTSVLLEPMTIGPFEAFENGAYGFECGLAESPVTIESGKTYIVDWNGTQYTVSCCEFVMDDGTILYLGNPSLVGFSEETANNEPFCVAQVGTVETDGFMMIYTTSEGTTNTIGLSVVDAGSGDDSNTGGESGGSTTEEVVMTHFIHNGKYGSSATSSATTVTGTASVTIPAGATIVFAGGYRCYYDATSLAGLYYTYPQRLSSNPTYYTVTENGDNITVSCNVSMSVAKNCYYFWEAMVQAQYTHPSITATRGQDGGLIVTWGEGIKNLDTITAWTRRDETTVADLSKSEITALPYAFFAYHSTIKTVYLPQTLTSIASGTFSGCSALEVVDLSRCTAVPTIGSTTFPVHADNFEIRVPAALYDEFRAATNWSGVASYIVAV